MRRGGRATRLKNPQLDQPILGRELCLLERIRHERRREERGQDAPCVWAACGNEEEQGCGKVQTAPDSDKKGGPFGRAKGCAISVRAHSVSDHEPLARAGSA